MTFAELFNQLPEIDGLKSTERLVLICLKWHCGQNGHCWWGKTKLAKEVGIDIQTLERAIRKLEAVGWIKRKEVRGKPNEYSVVGVLKQPSLKITQGQNAPGTLPQNEGDTLPQNAPPKVQEKVQEKKTKVRTPKNAITKDETEEAIKEIGRDLGKYREKYPDTDIEGCFEDFSDHFLCKKDLKTEKPNWMLWTDWNKAFWNWLRKPWNRDRKIAKKSWRDA